MRTLSNAFQQWLQRCELQSQCRTAVSSLNKECLDQFTNTNLSVKDGQRSQDFSDNDTIITVLKKWAASASSVFYAHGIQNVVNRRRKRITNYIQKNNVL